VKPADIDFDRLLKRLNLANTRRVWRDLVARAEKEQWSFHDFLATLVGEEIAQRSHTRLGRLSHRAQFPFLKTIDEFDFTYQSSVRLALLGSALSADFVTEGRSLVLLGKPGRGKTHLAVAIAYRAIQNGFEALFVTAAGLIDELSAAFRKGRLAEALARFTHPHVLVVDEVSQAQALDDLHHQQAARCVGACASRRRSRAGDRRSGARARTPASSRRAIDAHQASRP
jgi:DNA replication protein DnaC